MSTRADLEAALAEAEAEFATADAEFATASTHLAKGYAVPAETEGDLPEAFSKLAKARASCLAACAALARLNFAEGKPRGYRYERRRMAHQAASEKAHTTRRMAGAERRKANVDRRLARSALANLNHAEPIVKTDKLMKGAINSAKPGTTASPSDWDAKLRSTQSNEHLVRAVEKSATRQPRPQKESRRLAGRFSAQEVSSKDTGAWRSLAWQTVELSSLTLAYLLYYYIDVNLQIAMLPPSVSSLFVG